MLFRSDGAQVPALHRLEHERQVPAALLRDRDAPRRLEAGAVRRLLHVLEAREPVGEGAHIPATLFGPIQPGNTTIHRHTGLGQQGFGFIHIGFIFEDIRIGALHTAGQDAVTARGVAFPHAIDEACNLALGLLRELDMEHALQADLQWCIGSYQADGNPVGLYQMLERAVIVFEREKEAGNKKITAKITQALSKALKG